MSEPEEPQTLAQTDDTDEDAPQIVPEADLHFPAAGAASSDQPQSIYRAELADTVSLLNISKPHCCKKPHYPVLLWRDVQSRFMCLLASVMMCC